MNIKKCFLQSCLVVSSLFLAQTSQAYQVSITTLNSQKVCTVDVSGSTTGTAVSIDYVAPNSAVTRLVTNLLPDSSGLYNWSGPVPNYPSFEAGSSVKVYTNQLVNTSTALPECTVSQPASYIGFAGIFAPDLWIIGSNPQVNLVDTTTAPAKITLKNYPAWASSGAVLNFASAPNDGTVKFDYNVTNSNPDCPAGYVNNGITTMLPEGAGTAQFDVNAGSSFGFALNGQNTASNFGCLGYGGQITYEVSNFSFTE